MSTRHDTLSPLVDSRLFDPDGFPWLENGERMDQRTFHERYKRLPSGYKAELIEGVVYVMPSPLSIRHGRNDARLGGWLFLYSAETPGTEVQNNTTTVLGDSDEPQPDAALLILPEFGGQTRDGEGDNDFTIGAPELVVEVALSSRSVDGEAKLRAYERAGVREYLLRDLRGGSIRWFAATDGTFRPIEPDVDGILRSQAFPGLWLDPRAFLANDKPAILATLRLGLASPEHAVFVDELERRRVERAGDIVG